MSAWVRAVCMEREQAFEDQIKSVVRLLRRPAAGNHQDHRLLFSRLSPGIGVRRRGNVAFARGDTDVTAAVCNVWMSSNKLCPLTWTIELRLEEINDGMVFGIVGRNYRDGKLTASRHAVVVRASDGGVVHKGADTSLFLRPMKAGDTLRLTVEMQTLTLTVSLVGDHHLTSSEVSIDKIPHEVAVAVQFAKGPPQRVRILRFATEKPMGSSGRLSRSKALWDDESVQQPLQKRLTYMNLFSWRDRAPVHCELEETSVASSLS